MEAPASDDHDVSRSARKTINDDALDAHATLERRVTILLNIYPQLANASFGNRDAVSAAASHAFSHICDDDHLPQVIALVRRSGRIVDFLDVAQVWLDWCPAHALYHRVLHLLTRLARTTEQLPRSLFIRDVDLGGERDPFDTSGGFSDVFYGVYLEKVVVLKRLRINVDADRDSNIYRALCREALVWRQLRHRYILPFIGIDTETFPRERFLPCLVSPYMHRGTLRRYVQSSVYQPSKDLYRLLLEAAEGIEYLHSQHIVHGDIKDANILIDDGCHVQLCDFGLALIAESAGMQTTNSSGQGTRSWMSPERLAEEDHQLAVADDIYAYACLGYYLFALQAPFRDLRDTAIILKVCNGERPARPSSDTSTGCLLSDQIWTLVEACWSQAARDRPTIGTARACLEAATASSPPSDTSQTALSTISLRTPAPTVRPAPQPASKQDAFQTMMGVFLGQPGFASVATTLRGDVARDLLDVLHGWLHSATAAHPLYPAAVNIMLQVSVASLQLPRAMFVHGVDFTGQTAPTFYGGFSEVWKAVYRGRVVSVKRYKATRTSAVLLGGWHARHARPLAGRLGTSDTQVHDDEVTNPLACREAVLWSTLHHPSILPFLGVDTQIAGTGYSLVSPWVRGIRTYTDNYRDTEHRSRLLFELADGLSYLHSQHIVHGNIHHNTVFVDDAGHACLGSFSIAMLDSEVDSDADPWAFDSRPGATGWMSPERMQEDHRITFRDDVFGFGCLLYCMFTGGPPFSEFGSGKATLSILRGQRPSRPVMRDCLGAPMTDGEWLLCQRCWAQEAEDRPFMAHVLRALQADAGVSRELAGVLNDAAAQHYDPAEAGPGPPRERAALDEASPRLVYPGQKRAWRDMMQSNDLSSAEAG